ncbi:MAG: OsmC family protein [Gemmatimonadota bacterium]
MTGTLGGALEARGIPSANGALRAHVRGEINEHDGTLKIDRIRVRYEIRIPSGTREATERALEVHASNCPVARTLMPCVQIDWEADIEEG